jgi:hypothetical protein
MSFSSSSSSSSSSSPSADADADAIADRVLSAYDLLPKKFQPRVVGGLDDENENATGRQRRRSEWVPLAGIVLCRSPRRKRRRSCGAEV